MSPSSIILEAIEQNKFIEVAEKTYLRHQCPMIVYAYEKSALTFYPYTEKRKSSWTGKGGIHFTIYECCSLLHCDKCNYSAQSVKRGQKPNFGKQHCPTHKFPFTKVNTFTSY